MPRHLFILCTALIFPHPAHAEEPLARRVAATLAEAGSGTRFGFVVADENGRELIAISPDDRFIPASNTKMFPTAAAFALLPGLDAPDTASGASVRLAANGKRPPDVILTGHGDARMSSAPDCRSDCLATLADAVAAQTRRVGVVIGDDSLFPDQRWSPGMSWNNIPTRSGTAVSALTLDDNEIALRVTPTTSGAPPKLEAAFPYYEIDSRAVTITAGGETELTLDRLPGERVVRLSGTIAMGAEPEIVGLGIDDPAHYAAWRLAALLEARGVRVGGTVSARHRPFGAVDDPRRREGTPVTRAPEASVLARLTPPPLAEDLTLINKVSQNLHAELLLRRIALIDGSGSLEDGHATIAIMLGRAGVARGGYDFSDGSGMSTYNRLSPRAVVTFLRWVAGQPWGGRWRATLPVGGVDGTLAKRFKGTALEGKLTAKTGTINATNALSGYLIAKSGRTLTFSIFANDVPAGANARQAMDAALVLVAGES